MKCDYCGEDALYQLKNGKWCCKKSTNSCPSVRRKNSKSQKINYRFTVNPSTIRVKCKFCQKITGINNIKRHEISCFQNPINIKFCIVCGKQLTQKQIDYKNETCSYVCSNKYFANIRNKPEKYKNYRAICFYNHEKKCVICGEDKIVSVHHYDGDKTNNNRDNLIPLCPTHHQYLHSRHRELIIDKIEEYRKNIE